MCGIFLNKIFFNYIFEKKRSKKFFIYNEFTIISNLRVLIIPHKLIIGQRFDDRLKKVHVVLDQMKLKYL